MKVFCIDKVDLYSLKDNTWYIASRTVNNLYDIHGIGLVPCNKFITEAEYKKTKREESIEIVLN